MNKIFTIMLVVLFSSNVFAEVTEQDYIDEAKKNANQPIVSKFYLQNGKYGYHMYAVMNEWIFGAFEARASELCGTKGYTKTLDEKSGNNRRQIIQCNE